MGHLLEDWIEHSLEHNICRKYWDSATDHKDFRKIINAIDNDGGSLVDIPGVLRELDKAGYIIRKQNEK